MSANKTARLSYYRIEAIDNRTTLVTFPKSYNVPAASALFLTKNPNYKIISCTKV